MPETAFLGAQIAPKSDSRSPTPKVREREGRGGPRKIVHPEKFLRIGPDGRFVKILKNKCLSSIREKPAI